LQMQTDPPRGNAEARASATPSTPNRDKETGLALADFDVLAQLSRAGGELRMTELAARALISRSGMTRRVARLVDQGLLQRGTAGNPRSDTLPPNRNFRRRQQTSAKFHRSLENRRTAGAPGRPDNRCYDKWRSRGATPTSAAPGSDSRRELAASLLECAGRC